MHVYAKSDKTAKKKVYITYIAASMIAFPTTTSYVLAGSVTGLLNDVGFYGLFCVIMGTYFFFMVLFLVKDIVNSSTSTKNEIEYIEKIEKESKKLLRKSRVNSRYISVLKKYNKR